MRTLRGYIVARELDADKDTMTLKVPKIFFNPADALQAKNKDPQAIILRISLNYPQSQP